MRVYVLISLLACATHLAAQSLTSRPWELESSETTAGLRGVHNVGGGVVWASGTDGTIRRSEDTGYLWQQCATPPGGNKLDFRSIWAWDAQLVLAMSSGPGQQSRLYRSTDGCTSWKLVLTNPDPAGFWDGLLFFDRTHGVIYGDPVPDDSRNQSVLPMYMTTDGGNTWKLDSGSPRALSGESIFAASNSAMTFKQGKTWLGTNKRIFYRNLKDSWDSTRGPLPSENDSSGVFSVAFRDQLHGIAVGGDYRKPAETSGTAAYTADGGKHWKTPRKLPHGYRSAVAWDAQNHAWITVGSNGSDISYDDGATWQWLDGGNWNALSFPWAVGPNGQIGKLGPLPSRRSQAAAGVSR